MKFEAWIDGTHIRCRIDSDRAVEQPVFCFSCMAPVKVLEGGEMVRSLGGYAEVQLPDLVPGRVAEVTIAHLVDAFAPKNRAWLPLGAYLRAGTEVIDLPRLPAGVRREGIARPKGTVPALTLCPQPQRFEAAGGEMVLSGVVSDHPALRRADQLAQRTGLGRLLRGDGSAVELVHDPARAVESYKIQISDGRVAITYGSDAGLFYAGVSLATLMVTHTGRIPCGVIEDAPRFEWRGQHLDCARHFYEVETILRLLDVMALMKLNRFHWHFADDEAFRLELACLPELRATHFRGEGELLPGVFGGGARSGGSYSRADVIRVLAHAEALGIQVMPEIEVPAHALALARVYPDARDPEESGDEQSVQGYAQNVLNPAMPESWRIWEAMVQEIAEIFPFSVLHLGGDELPEDTWAGSPAVDALKVTEGLQTADDVMGWTMHRLAQKVVALGKTPAGWEESARGRQGIGNDAILFSWTGQGPGLEAARAGYRVVMTPGQKVYLDMAQTDAQDDWGASWAAIIGLADTIAWDPVPDEEPELAQKIIGVQGTFWSEFTTCDDEMEPMIAPRILGVATMGWQERGSADPTVLHALADTYALIFRRMGWRAS
ncbi:MAG: beta-N-acetylhexosaminidase [Marivivens sp.]|nr:beta-N-acetylhexosaminidase [Marivivens sp.]